MCAGNKFTKTANQRVLCVDFKTINTCQAFQQSQCTNNHLLRFLTSRIQPAHLIVLLSALITANFLISGQHNEPCIVLKLLYLSSFASHCGAQMWMTFISGLSLYFSLPRHTFASVQKILFPRYFLLNALLSWMTLYSFVKQQSNDMLQTHDVLLQVAVLTSCFLLELLVRLYGSPRLLELISLRNMLEERAGVGSEVGTYEPGQLSECPYYAAVHKSFRRTHATIAIANMVTMACTGMHLYYLSQRICF